MCSCEDAEPCEVWCETSPVARKQHRCHECRAPILKGEKHRRVTGIFDGEPFSYRQCLKCVQRLRAFAVAEECHPGIGSLLESILECGREDRRFWPGFRVALKKERRLGL